MTKEEIALEILVAVIGNERGPHYTIDNAKQVAEAYNVILETIKVPASAPEK